MTIRHQIEGRAGIGLRLPHIAEMVATRPPAEWLEIHPENFLANPHAAELLTELARHYPISVHMVGISIGSASGIDRHHLERLRKLIERINPALVSGHLAWSTHGSDYLNDLLPLPFTDESLKLVTDHLQQVQDVLGRSYLVENPSSYVRFKNSTMTEAEFLAEIAARTGCGLLCDVSNVYLSAHNMGYDPYEYLEQIPPKFVRELHLGGYTPEEDESSPGMELLVDTHAAPVSDPAWGLYTYALGRFGAKPTLIEWDNDIPALPMLLEQAARAEAIIGAVQASETNYVAG
jgi:uncharacterized protein (UPF0276 family)